MTKMNPEVKKLWVEALRSPKYKQQRHQLRDGTTNSMCCLGVLCDVSGLGRWLAVGEYDCGEGDINGFRPTSAVAKWAGIDSDMVWQVEINGVMDDLARHNDNGRTFLEIADAIEAQL